MTSASLQAFSPSPQFRVTASDTPIGDPLLRCADRDGNLNGVREPRPCCTQRVLSRDGNDPAPRSGIWRNGEIKVAVPELVFCVPVAGERVPVTPSGNPEKLNVTVPITGAADAVEIVVVAVPPACTTMPDVCVNRVKSGGVTISVSGNACVYPVLGSVRVSVRG